MSKKIQNKLTKAQYEILTPYSEQLTSASNGYVRGIYQKDIDILKPIYESFGYNLTHTGCGGCILSMLRTLNKYYTTYGTQNTAKQ